MGLHGEMAPRSIEWKFSSMGEMAKGPMGSVGSSQPLLLEVFLDRPGRGACRQTYLVSRAIDAQGRIHPLPRMTKLPSRKRGRLISSGHAPLSSKLTAIATDIRTSVGYEDLTLNLRVSSRHQVSLMDLGNGVLVSLHSFEFLPVGVFGKPAPGGFTFFHVLVSHQIGQLGKFGLKGFTTEHAVQAHIRKNIELPELNISTFNAALASLWLSYTRSSKMRSPFRGTLTSG